MSRYDDWRSQPLAVRVERIGGHLPVEDVVRATQLLGLTDVTTLAPSAQGSESGPALGTTELVLITFAQVPSGDGRALLAQRISGTRATGFVGPMMVVSAVQDPGLAAECLWLGADDVVAENMNRWEILARLYRLVRKAKREAVEATGPLRLVEQRGCEQAGFFLLRRHDLTASVRGSTIRLTPTQFRLLERLTSNEDTWLRVEDLQREVLGVAAGSGASNVRYHVFRTRNVLGEYGDLIHGWRGRGYMWSLQCCDTPHCDARVVSDSGFREVLDLGFERRSANGS